MSLFKKVGLLLCGVLSLAAGRYALGGEYYHHVSTRPTADLKKYMANFGTMLSSLEIIRLKEKKPDWEAIDIAVQDMNKNLAAMQKADQKNAYKEFTDVLAAGLVELSEKSKKRDPAFFSSLDKLSETCFKCHAAHRPGDYFVPKGDPKLSTEN